MFSKTEITQPNIPISWYYQVLWLQILVHDILRVNILQPSNNAGKDESNSINTSFLHLDIPMTTIFEK